MATRTAADVMIDVLREWNELMEERGTRRDKPMKPQVLAWEIGRRLQSDAIVSSDSGTIATWFARQMPVQLEAVVDPHEPPMPPKIKRKQAVHFGKSLVRGTPELMQVVTTIAESRVRELV